MTINNECVNVKVNCYGDSIEYGSDKVIAAVQFIDGKSLLINMSDHELRKMMDDMSNDKENQFLVGESYAINKKEIKSITKI